MLSRLLFNLAEMQIIKHGKVLAQKRLYHCISSKSGHKLQTDYVSKPRPLVLTNTRNAQSWSKSSGKGIFVAIIPLSMLGLVIWAFVFGGVSLKQVAKDDPLPLAEADEIIYLSKVELLQKERRKRQRTVANEAKINGNEDSH